MAVWIIVPYGSCCIEEESTASVLEGVCTAVVFRERDRGSRPILNLVTHYESIQYPTPFSFTAFFFLPLLCYMFKIAKPSRDELYMWRRPVTWPISSSIRMCIATKYS